MGNLIDCLWSETGNVSMVLADLIGPDTRLYAKSEWEPAGELQPAFPFSQRVVANRV